MILITCWEAGACLDYEVYKVSVRGHSSSAWETRVNSRACILLESNFQNVIRDMGMAASPRDSLYHLDMCVRGAGSQPYLTCSPHERLQGNTSHNQVRIVRTSGPVEHIIRERASTL